MPYRLYSRRSQYLDSSAAYDSSVPHTFLSASGSIISSMGYRRRAKTNVTLTDNYTGLALSNVTITGTAGQFSCNYVKLSINDPVTITGTNTGTGGITGYVSGTTYYIIATNGSTNFTLSASLGGSAITTNVGTPVGYTYTANNTSVYDSTDVTFTITLDYSTVHNRIFYLYWNNSITTVPMNSVFSGTTSGSGLGAYVTINAGSTTGTFVFTFPATSAIATHIDFYCNLS